MRWSMRSAVSLLMLVALVGTPAMTSVCAGLCSLNEWGGGDAQGGGQPAGAHGPHQRHRSASAPSASHAHHHVALAGSGVHVHHGAMPADSAQPAGRSETGIAPVPVRVLVTAASMPCCDETVAEIASVGLSNRTAPEARADTATSDLDVRTATGSAIDPAWSDASSPPRRQRSVPLRI